MTTKAITDGDLIRKRGRPRVAEPQSSVSTWLPAKHHDRLIQLSRTEEMSVSALVRRAVVVFLLDDSSN